MQSHGTNDSLIRNLIDQEIRSTKLFLAFNEIDGLKDWNEVDGRKFDKLFGKINLQMTAKWILYLEIHKRTVNFSP